MITENDTNGNKAGYVSVADFVDTSLSLTRNLNKRRCEMILNITETAVADSINNLDSAEIFEFLRIVLADLEYEHLKGLQNEVNRQLKYNYNES